MGISIKHDEIEAMIRELAQRRGSGITETIGAAVRAELDRLSPTAITPDGEMQWRKVQELQTRIARQGIDRSLSEDDILGYDRNGVPAQRDA